MTRTERVIELRSGAIRFRVLSAGGGPPLVYFHSIFERTPWPALVDRLASRYTVFAPQHPGVGGSEGVEALETVIDLALAYDELFVELGVGPAFLCGHFFGGMVAAELAAIFPAHASALALLSPLGLWRDDCPLVDVIITPADDVPSLIWKDPSSPVAQQWAVLPDADEAKVALEVESIQRLAAVARFVWPIPDKGLKTRLHRLTAPTLLVWGDADQVSPVAYAEEWQRRVKESTVKILPGGHMLPHERPDLVADTIAEFFG